jgi:ATP-binding cassette subfamily F protein 3
LSVQNARNTQNIQSSPNTQDALASSQSKLSYEEQKAQARAQKKKEKALAEAEAEVAQLEGAIALLEEQMATEAGSQDMSLYEKHTKLKQQLSQAEERWMELME